MVACPLCPLCSGLPWRLFPTQWMCRNPDCTVLTWNPQMSLDENLTTVNTLFLQTEDDDGALD